MPASTTSEITRQRLALQLLGAHVNTDDALHAAARLEAQREPPNLLEHIAPTTTDDLPSLLWPANPPPLRNMPAALFDALPELSPVDLPMDWLPMFLAWGQRQRRWQGFTRYQMLITKAGESARDISDFQVNDSLAAGLLLLRMCPEPDSPLRHQLFTLALTRPLGAYLAAESHHLPEEVPAIVAALKEHRRLLYQVSHLPHFGNTCLQQAKSGHTVWDGLILARRPDHQETLQHWLRRLAETACQVPAAAAAALVLQPAAPENQHALWRSMLETPAAARWAFEAVWWARHTWSPEQWSRLKNQLRPYATADRGPGWFNWSRLEFEWVRNDFEQNPVQPLWAVEWLRQCHETGQPVNDQPLRNQMVERLIQNHGDSMATVVLRFLDELQNREASR